jgi:hypothetical protein
MENKDPGQQPATVSISSAKRIKEIKEKYHLGRV